MLKKLLAFIEERRRIRIKRESCEPWPWTKDIILQQYRFCEVYRELDRVTTWIRKNWREPYAQHNNLWFAMCIARQINWPDSLEAIGFPERWEPKRVRKILEKRKLDGKKVYTSAYLLGGGNTQGVSKIEYTVKILDNVWKSFHKVTPTFTDFQWPLQGVFEWLLQFHGFGKFLSYEVVTDLRHTRYLEHAVDKMTWANIGPGAQRGLNRLYERELHATHPQAQLLEELLLVMDWIVRERNTDLLPTWEARDMEHCECEWDKRERAEERLKAGKIVGLERFRPPGLLSVSKA